ncbi:MAG TPA: type II toxin-antitoxin system PemK/MazF family toxin [Bacteroidia bacterium]|nr:type II toxin-antitoxin system PemK/MazF family toxin [Bacteroidia bacterium]
MVNRINNLKTGEIHWIDFGKVKDHCIAGFHPALVIDRDRMTVRVIPITDNFKENCDNGEIPLPKGAGNLRKSSKLMMRQMTTVDVSSLKGRLGKVNRRYLELVRESIKRDLIDRIDREIDESENNLKEKNKI